MNSIVLEQIVDDDDQKKDSDQEQDIQPCNLKIQPSVLSNSIERININLIEQNAQQMQKKITMQFLNKLRLMVKPSEKTFYLISSLLSIIANTNQAIPLSVFEDDSIQWLSLQEILKQPILIIESLRNFSDLLKHRKIRIQGLKLSTHFLLKSQSSSGESDQITQTLEDTIVALQQYVKESYNPCSRYKKNISINQLEHQKESQSKKNNHQRNSSNFSNRNRQKSKPKQLDDLQSFISEKQHTSTNNSNKDRLNSRRNSHDSDIKTHNTSFRRRSSSRSIDFRDRVLTAQDKKISRLDRILKLKVQKPEIQARVLSSTKSSKQNVSQCFDQKSLLIEQIRSYQQEVKQLKSEESKLKWEVEREVKLRQKYEEKQEQLDEFERYRQQKQTGDEFILSKDFQQICKKHINHNKENPDDMYIEQLKRELMKQQEQREKLERTMALMKCDNFLR